MPLLRPRRLAPGQTIGMVAPSAAPNDPERIRFAIDTVESLGFKVKPGAHLFDRDGYLAGSDAARADDLNAMFADDGVDAIWCVRGGYGASRILPARDYALMQRKPKALIGYSDITALHVAIHRHAGLVTFHGPVAFRAFTPYSLGELKGVLAGVAGVAFGKFTNCNSSPFFLQNRPLDDILAERCRALGVPAVSGIMVGHIEDQTTLPVGCLAELDADAGTLTLLEPGVS